VLSVALSGKQFTRYGIHTKNKGKEDIVNRLADRIMSVKCKHEIGKFNMEKQPDYNWKGTAGGR
jgi:hypothetical protein